MQAAVATAQAPPSPAPDVRATTEAAIAATVEALRPTSTTEAVPLALASTPTPTPTKTPTPRPAIATRTPTKTPATGPTIPTRTPTKAPTTRPPPTPTPSVSLRDFTNGRWLEQEDPRLASSIKELGWVRDGIDGTESEAIQDLLYIAVTSRSVVSSLVSLSWVQDGIGTDEAEAIDWINNMSGAEVMSAVVALGWVQDGIDDALEVRTIEKLSYIAYDDTGLGLSIVSLGWVQDGIEDIEARAIDWISNIEGAEVMSAVVALGWVRDGINDLEVKTIEELSYIAYENTELGLDVVALGWVQDGIEDIEARAIDWISNIKGAEVASAVVALGWVQDSIDDLEVQAFERLSYISLRDTAAALRIVGMPFVETIEPPDISAMASLSRLAASERNIFDRVMSHAALRDGISDDLAPIVATLRGVARTNVGLIDILLDPNRVSLERRTVTLPLAGDVVLAIIRTAPGAERSMDLLEHSVRAAERSMGLPLPTRYVGLLYENAVSGSSAGTNFGTHVAITLPEYDIDDGSREAGVRRLYTLLTRWRTTTGAATRIGSTRARRT